MTYAVIKMRGVVKSKPDVHRTLQLLNIERTNHCTLIEENVHYKGMLQKVKDYVAWGHINVETLSTLLHSRGLLEGRKRLTDTHIKANTDYDTIDSFARAIIDGKASLQSVPQLKPVIRLHPPRKGHKGIKKPFPEGVLGYHGDDINELLLRMR
ncbi:MAG: 50S ribosomal protein L30 [Euryarchaeota archaeon]|nr:50S ribosomal protein L30 [Euryarchaeota archaeon]